MTRPAVLAPAARLELQEAARWLARRNPDAARKLREATAEATRRRPSGDPLYRLRPYERGRVEPPHQGTLGNLTATLGRAGPGGLFRGAGLCPD